MNELDLIRARMIARLAYIVVGGFTGLAFLLVGGAILIDKMTPLANQAVIGLVGLAGGAAGFAFGRHSVQGGAGDPDVPTSPAVPASPPPKEGA